MTEIKKLIAESIAAAANNAVSTDEIIASFTYPPSPELGDLALPCFKFARAMHKSPVLIAEELASTFKSEAVCRAEAAQGYLNLFFDRGYLISYVTKKVLCGDRPYGSSNEGQGKTVVLDYSSPNVAKPFHIGHLGTTVIGHSIKKLHAFAGYNCVGVNHLGDWGTQFGKLIVAYRKWGDKHAVEEGEIDELVALYVRFHEEAEKDESLNDAARAEFAKLEAGDAENLALWKWFIEISLREYKKTYDQLGITFDSYAGESFYINSNKVPAVIERLKEKNLLTVDDGATIVNLEEYNMPPCIILKSDGSSIYHTRDIAAAVYRKETYDFAKCIYVTSSGQCLHFAQLFKVLELMGFDWCDQMVHVPYGTVSIDGSKLATRTGNVVLLKDLFATAIEKARSIIDEKNPNLENKDKVAEQVGVGAVIFHYLLGGRIKDMNFIMEDALSFDGNTGPYAQYTYARTRSIMRRAEISDVKSLCNAEAVSASPAEGELCKVICRFPERVKNALDEYEPSVITRYILDLCTAFNRFYHECPILTAEDETLRNTRLALTASVSEVLANALDLICIGRPEQI